MVLCSGSRFVNVMIQGLVRDAWYNTISDAFDQFLREGATYAPFGSRVAAVSSTGNL